LDLILASSSDIRDRPSGFLLCFIDWTREECAKRLEKEGRAGESIEYHLGLIVVSTHKVTDTTQRGKADWFGFVGEQLDDGRNHLLSSYITS